MVRAAALLLLASAWLADPALAQSSQPDEGEGAEANSVFVFNRVCYGQVPKLQGIRNMAAQLGWSPLDDKDLTQFSPDEKAEVVLGWDAPIGERAFRVAVTQGAISDALIETFPDFAEGVSTSCTLVLDGFDPAAQLLADVNALAGKAPASENVAAGGLFTTTWAGGNADVKVFLNAKTDELNLGTLINVVVLTK